MGIRGCQHPAPKSLQIRVSLDRDQELFGYALTAIRFQYENVSQVRKGCLIGHNATKSNLPLLWFTASGKIGAKNHRICNRTLDQFARNAESPVALFAQETPDELPVQRISVSPDFAF
jgi:hypothetical protein